MKTPFLPRPTRDELLTSPLHLVARDFPETLAELRAHGLAVDRMGDRSLQELGVPDAILRALQASTAWRPRAVVA